jgi:ABC-type transport system involved in Fe-S cluster assembly fused permease/ATPase subunit
VEGRVELKEVVVKYRPDLPPVLKGLSMTIQAGEKIGFVGRYAFFLGEIRDLIEHRPIELERERAL